MVMRILIRVTLVPVLVLTAALALGAQAAATPLHDAVYEGDVQTVERLLAQGADPGATNERGYTPLYYAVWSGATTATLDNQVEIVRVLLGAGADPNQTSGVARLTALHVVTEELNRNSAEVARLLLEAGADPYQYALEGAPLHYLFHHGGPELEANEAYVLFLLDAYDPTWGLLITAKLGEYQLGSKWLAHVLATGVDPNVKDYAAHTALGYAAWQGLQENVRLLLDAGADPGIVLGGVDGIGENSALNLVSRACHPEVVCLLLDAGADPNWRVGDGPTPLMAALDDWSDTIDIVSPNQDEWEIEHLAQNCPAVVRILSDAGADANAADADGDTALHVHAFSGSAELVRMLLELGADPRVKDSIGETPLDKAEERTWEDWDDFQGDYDETIRLLRQAMEQPLSGPAAPYKVRAVQKALASLGYNPGPADGKMGPMTEAALKEWRRDSGLEPTGVLTVSEYELLVEQAE